jgi:hypothetical protein
MACTLRRNEEFEPLPPAPGLGRMARLQALVCGNVWGNRDDICLIYWKPENGGRWVAWVDSAAPPKVDPLPEAGVTVP